MSEDNARDQQDAANGQPWVGSALKIKQDNELIRASRSVQRDFRKPIWRAFLSAVRDYGLIREGDKVACCVSGGKDSLLLAVCLRELNKYSNVPFELQYLCMDPGYTKENREAMEQNFRRLGIAPKIFETDIFATVDGLDQSPCHVCAAMRRGYLYKEAQKLGCNKIALGHHMDDVVETILMSLLYGGEYKTMMPLLNADNWPGMQLIRPLYLVREKDIIAWRDHMRLDTLRCACRMTRGEASGGARARVKQLVAQLEGENNAIFGNVFHSSEHVDLDYVMGYRLPGSTEVISVLEGRQKPPVQIPE